MEAQPEGTAAGILGRSAGPSGSDGGAPAVGGEDGASDVAGLRGRQEGDDRGDLAGLGGTGEQGRGTEGLDAFARGPGGQHRPGSDGIDPDPEGTELGCPGPVIDASAALVAP